jgi:predicted ATPase
LLAARALAEQCLDLGDCCNDSTARAIGHQYLGICASYLGRLVLGRAHLEQALALGDPKKPEALVLVDHAHVWCRSHLSATLLLLGYPMKALSCSRQAMADAKALANPEDLACALSFEAGNYHDVRSVALARERADALIALATERGLPHWLAEGILFRGWTLAEGGAVDEAIEHMSRGIAILRTVENRIGMQYWLLTSAEVHGRAGRAAPGLALLGEALELGQRNSARWYEAEVHRLRGDLLRRMANPDATQIESCLQKAIEVAREQGAKWWELRAATSLAELWRKQGKRKEACDLLAPIYGWFTEGFDTADLREAKALLDEWS